jgi:hypothetical protein
MVPKRATLVAVRTPVAAMKPRMGPAQQATQAAAAMKPRMPKGFLVVAVM